MLDIKIVNGKIIDAKNNSTNYQDIGIKNGRIIKIGSIYENALLEIDADGKYVSPGFIDIHMHEEDLSLLKNEEYDIANTMLNMGVTTSVGGNCGNNRQDIKEFASFVNQKGSPVNYMSAIGHNYLRNIVGNEDRYKKSSKLQAEKMRKLVNEAIDFGAIGVSYGLEYCPGIDVDEAVFIAADIKERKDLLLSAHYRKDAKFALDAINEMAQIARLTSIPFQISHLSSCSAYGNMKQALELIDSIIADGVDLKVDAYPYDAFSTYIGSAVFDEGCFELWNKDYNSIMMAEDPYRGVFCDKDLFYKVRKEYPNMLVIAYVMIEDEIIMAYGNPNVMVASDGLYRSNQGHPRGAGTFPRVIGKYCRDMGALDFYDVISKMTYQPAKRLGLNNKGLIEEGFDADIVIFDYDKIIDKATFLDPQLRPDGIDYVIVNGKLAVEKGVTINNRLGKFIKK